MKPDVPLKQQLFEKAERERRLCRDWLVAIMRRSRTKTRTKSDLRAEAMRRFGASKTSFDHAWIAAIEETGNSHWYDPLPRAKRRPDRQRDH